MKKIELSERFTYGKLLRYSLPGIGSMLAITSFQLVDGYFVSNLLGVTPFTAVNLISPAFFVLYAMGFLFGTGGSALVAQRMGAGEERLSREVFTMTVTAMILAGAALGGLSALCMPALARLVGATPSTLDDCVAYGRLLTLFLPAYLINAAFQSLWITAQKAWTGFWISLVNGAGNVALDWLFMGPMGLGIRGAALATSLSATLTAAVILVYFSRPNPSALRFVRFPAKRWRELGSIITNGASEMVDSVSGNLAQLAINGRLLYYVGEVGVAAMGVYNYVIELFMAVFFGVSATAVTVVGYKYGERDRAELSGLLRRGTALMVGFGAAMAALCAACAEPIAALYLGYDAEAAALAVRALRVGGFSCLFSGFSLFAASFFTGLGDGLSSAVIAAVQSLVAPVAMVWLLPAAFGANAIWLALPTAGAVSCAVCVALLRTRYPGRMARMMSEE